MKKIVALKGVMCYSDKGVQEPNNWRRLEKERDT